MMKVLIIGENSYIGNHLKDYLEQFQFTNDPWNVDKVGAVNEKWKQKDFRGYDCVIQMAAIVHRREKKNMEELYTAINRDMTVAIAKKAKESGVRQFVFMSTMAVYGSDVSRITRTTIPCPSTFYGKSKYEAEQRIKELETDDFKIAIVRPPMVYGQGCKGNYEKLNKLSKLIWVFPDYHNRRSTIHIEALCEHLYSIIKYNENGYFFPQDKEYLDVCNLLISMRNGKGKRTYVTGAFNGMIDRLRNKSKTINKVFGDCYYDMD